VPFSTITSPKKHFDLLFSTSTSPKKHFEVPFSTITSPKKHFEVPFSTITSPKKHFALADSRFLQREGELDEEERSNQTQRGQGLGDLFAFCFDDLDQFFRGALVYALLFVGVDGFQVGGARRATTAEHGGRDLWVRWDLWVLRARLFGFGWRHGRKRSLFDGYLMAEHRVLRIAAVRRLF
jgi:hypothetical protein